MRITVTEPTFEIGKVGFKGRDLLSRASTGVWLSDVVERIEEPLVIAVDGAWGSGKSFFLKCWTGAHRIENEGTANVVYFDAFENDYLADPLIALVAEIERRVPVTAEQRSAMRTIKKAAGTLWRPGARIALAIATAGTTEVLGGVGDALAEAVSDELKETLDEKMREVWATAEAQHQAMRRFRSGLEALTASQGDQPGKKLVLVIDELDRCRPDYALTLLEVAKHFFSVPNVHFVLGANLPELQNSVRARYGQAIDAERYLQKFISVTMTLADGKNDAREGNDFHKYLTAHAPHFEISDSIVNEILYYFRNDSLKSIITLRDINRILTYCAVLQGGPKDLENLDMGERLVTLGLIILRAVKPSVYGKIRNGSLTIQELNDALLRGVTEQSDTRFWQLARKAWLGYLDAPAALEAEYKEALFEGHEPKNKRAIQTIISRRIEPVGLLVPRNERR